MLWKKVAMVDVLPGYTWDGSSSRYRSNATGRYVARRNVLSLVESQVNSTSARVGELTTALHEGRLSASTWTEQMRAELKRQHLAQSALGSGGWDRIGAREFGRVGGRIRQDYARVEQLARDIAEGKATLPQALARANSYVGSARTQFFDAERDRLQRSDSSMITIERRVLGSGGQHCKDCLDYYGRGWQLIGTLPSPGMDSVCGGACKCNIIYREVPAVEVNDWLGSKR